MRRIHPAGLYEAIRPLEENEADNYMIRLTNDRGQTVTQHDPYAFPNYMSDLDLHLLGEGTHWRSYDKLERNSVLVNNIEGRESRRLGSECKIG